MDFLPLLEKNELKFYVSAGNYLLATSENTNSYKVLDSFFEFLS